MSRYYDKEELKSQLEVEQIYDLLEAWGGEPEYTERGLICQTICHNAPGDGSRKLYYYNNGSTGLFHCYSSCGSMDIFELCIKVMKIQKDLEWELYDAMDYIASYFGFSGKEIKDEEEQLRDWQFFKRHSINRKSNLLIQQNQLKEFDKSILCRFVYPRISSWEQEGISPSVIRENSIGYYPGGEQITIPHFDINGRLIGIRGRTLGQQEAEQYGKYRPLKIGKTLYNHPLSVNLYHLNKSKENMRRARTAVVFESEKACLMGESYYGSRNDIFASCCGSSISSYQIDLLRKCGVQEIVIAFDRDFEEIEDDKFNRLKKKLILLNKRYGNLVKISVIFDKHKLLPLHASPIDAGPQIFEKLLNERFVPRED